MSRIQPLSRPRGYKSMEFDRDAMMNLGNKNKDKN